MARKSGTGRRLNAKAYFLLFLLVVGIGIFVFLRLNSDVELGLDARELPFGPGVSYSFSDRGVVYIIDNKLYYDDLARGKGNWMLELTAAGFSVTAGDEFIVIYSENMVQALDYSGVPKTTYLEFSSRILEARVGKTKFSLLRQDALGGFAISMITSEGEQLSPLDEMLKGYYVLDFDYYNGDNLWVMMMNTSTNSPVTTINTYEGNEKMTGMISIQDELVSDVYTNAAHFYVAGVYNLHMYSMNRSEEGSEFTYGWQVLDHYAGDSGASYFLLRNYDADEQRQGGEGRIITLPETTNPVDIRFPENCVDAFLQNGRVVMVMPDSARILNLNGTLLQTISLDMHVESAFKATNSRVILESGGKYYWLTLVS